MSDAPIIHFPTEDEVQQIKDDFFAEMRALREARQAATSGAKQCLPLLIDACRHKTGQSYKIRALLYSLWNGKPASLADTLNLDWALKSALLNVVLAFGDDAFFYDELQRAFQAAGLFDWFIEQGGQP